MTQGKTTWALVLDPSELTMYNLAKAGHLLDAEDVQKSVHDYFMSIVKQSVDKSPEVSQIKNLSFKRNKNISNGTPIVNIDNDNKPPPREKTQREAPYFPPGGVESDDEEKDSEENSDFI